MEPTSQNHVIFITADTFSLGQCFRERHLHFQYTNLKQQTKGGRLIKRRCYFTSLSKAVCFYTTKKKTSQDVHFDIRIF